MPATRKRKIHRGRVTKAPVRMRAMADAPPWMTAFEIEGALQPGTDCEQAYMFLENNQSHTRHRLLMNMLVLNPDEMVDDEMDEERTQRMDFYLEKTRSVDAEHLQYKVQLFIEATEQERGDDAFMCDLMGEVTYAEDEEMLEAANEMAVDDDDEAMSLGDDEAETADAEPAGAGVAGTGATVATAVPETKHGYGKETAAATDAAEADNSAAAVARAASAAAEAAARASDAAAATAAAHPEDAIQAKLAETAHTRAAKANDNAAMSLRVLQELEGQMDVGLRVNPLLALIYGVSATRGGTSGGAAPGGSADGESNPSYSSDASVPSIEPPRPLSDEPTDEQSSAEPSAELSRSKPEAVAANAHQDAVKGAAPAAAPDPVGPARREATAAYARTVRGLTSQPDDTANQDRMDGARSLNEAMALKANDCAMPALGVEPSDPKASRELTWLMTHHNSHNINDVTIQWHLAIQEFGWSTFFEQEPFAGVAGVRGNDSPLMLACSPIVFRKDGQTSRTRQSTPDIPGGLCNINLLSMSADRMAHAMRASVSQGAFESVTLKSVGAHPYIVVAFVQLFTHELTFKDDEDWLQKHYPKLVQLLYGPVAIVMAYKEPRQLLLVCVDDLRPGFAGMKSPPPIFKAGTAAIRTMIAKMITEEKGKLVVDANDKMLFAAEWPNGRESGLRPRSKLDELQSMQWAINAFRVSSMPTGNLSEEQGSAYIAKHAIASKLPKSKKQKLEGCSNDDSPNSSGVSSTSTARKVSKVTKPLSMLAQQRIAALPLALSTFNSDNTLTFSGDELAAMSDSLLAPNASPSRTGGDSGGELLTEVQKVIDKAWDRHTKDGDSRAVTGKYVSQSLSKLLNTVILPRLDKMKNDIELAKKPLALDELEAIKLEAAEYERNSITGIELLHLECKKYKPDYNPHNTAKKIKDANILVTTAAREALEKLHEADSESKRQKHSGYAPSPLVAQQSAGQSALAAQQREIADQQAASQALLAAQQREIAAKLETLEAKRTVDRERESQRQAAELKRIENLAQDASNRAALALQQQVAATHSAVDSKEKAEQEAHKLKIEKEEMAKKLAELQKEQAVLEAQRMEEAKGRAELQKLKDEMEARIQANNEQFNHLKVENARTVATMETKDSMHGTIDQLRDGWMQSMVGEAHMKGALTGLFASGGVGGPSGSNNAQWLANLQPLLMGGSGSRDSSSVPPCPRALMPPPPPRPPPPGPHKLLMDEGKDAADANVPSAVQSLIDELKRAEANAARPPPGHDPNYLEAECWAKWKQSLLETSQKIATLTALQYQHSKAEKYGDAEATRVEKVAMEATLEEQVTHVRALLDERRSPS